MKKAVLYAVLLLTFFRPGIIAQDFLDTVSYIPVVVTSWQDIAGDYRDGIPLIKAMGADAMVIANHGWNDLGILDPMKILHYRHKQDAEPYDIVKYTDASYVVYEAEGTNPEHGSATLNVVDSVGEVPSNADYAWTKGSKAGYLIDGPGVLMRQKYQDYKKDVLITYKTEYRLKLTNPEGIPIAPNRKICEIQITMRRKGNFNDIGVIFQKEISYAEFVGNILDQWHDYFIEYDLRNYGLEAAKQQRPPIWENLPDDSYLASFVEYRVFWYGVEGCTLYVDKVMTSDIRGREIKFDDDRRLDVSNAATTYKGSSNMLGWYGMEEPKFIDNYEPYRVVDSLIRAATQNTQFLHTSITTGENGTYWYGTVGTQGLSPIIEFAKRAKPHSIHLNSYHYDYPFPPDTPHYYKRNICYVIKNLNNMATLYREKELDFSFGVYGGDSWD